jgi:outer membrane lipoprotein carrier protein
MAIFQGMPIYLIFILLFFSFPFPAQAITGQELLERIQIQYENTRDMTAEFEQNTHVKMLNKIQKAKGKVYLKRPGKMRWEYREPQKKEIIINGNRMWTYDPFQKQVTITDLSKVSGSQTFLTFLTGMGDLRKDFRLEAEGSETLKGDGLYQLRLSPNDPKTPFSKLTLFVDSKTFQIRGTSFLGLQEDLTVINYKNIVINKGIPEEIFNFHPPEGTEIIYYPPIDNKEGQR